MEPAYVGLGGNLGDAAGRLRRAEGELAALPGVARVRLSSLWRSSPVGPVADQPWFVNACAELVFDRPPAPLELLDQLLAVEARAGRAREREVRQGPRPLDLDLLVWGDLVVDQPRLTLPHPRLAARAFALAPLVELAGPDLVIPGAGRAGDLLARALADPSQTVLRDDGAR
jgi:2-amino-4-hydroxy-6-hydroxymethyldihydropteridine diphosphokinase